MSDDEDTLAYLRVFNEAAHRECADIPVDGGSRGLIESGFIIGAEWGAGWAFAIIGMAQAIRDRYFDHSYFPLPLTVDEMCRLVDEGMLRTEEFVAWCRDAHLDHTTEWHRYRMRQARR